MLNILKRENGAVPLLLLLSIFSLVAFIAFSNFSSFRSNLFGSLFPKPVSRASGPGIVFVDSNNNPIYHITSPTVRFQLNIPSSQPISSATLAEDSDFTKGVVPVQLNANPTVATYTFSNSLGAKTLYVRFTSASGFHQDYSGTINLVPAK